LQKVLEGANIKLAAVTTDILGTSAREMHTLLVAGEHDLHTIAQHARGRMRPTIPDLRRALQGHLQPQQRIVVQRILAHVDFLDDSIRYLQQEIDAHLKPYQEALQVLQTIPGINATAAAVPTKLS
jgi:transposase